MRDIVAVIIPIYKNQLNKDEIISLRQCLNILSKHPIIFVGPESMQTQVYEAICINIVRFEIVKFKNEYFENIHGYNKLMLSSFFYRHFLSYRFILIYQLDAYVFKDELLFWCKKNYDFIGAPHSPHQNNNGEIQFLKGYHKIVRFFNAIFKTKRKISNVGNGGLSLRKTLSFYLLLKLLKHKKDRWGENNEDGFFKYWGNILYPFFKLPNDDVALRFSIETNPAQSLKKLGNQLPFGCHAFDKYEPLTWKKYINQDQSL